MRNNIFMFATSELSQDAFICWLANGFNCENEQLKKLAVEFVRHVSGEKEIFNVDIKRQYKKIDVLLLVNNAVAVIVEDKTFTGEHDNQIEKYKSIIENDAKYSGYKIRTVYFKTGFMYDSDYDTVTKIKENGGVFVGREHLMALLLKYLDETNNEILENFYNYLENIEMLDKRHGQYDKLDEDGNGRWNVSEYHIAQYKLMKEFFPDKQMNKCENNVYHGSSSGRPWTEYVIHCIQNQYYLFWRIDSDTKGPYISLRVYPDDHFYDKNDIKKSSANRLRYEKYYCEAEKYFSNLQSVEWKWSDVYPGRRAGCREAAIVTYHLENALHNWDRDKKGVIQNIRKITKDFTEDICPRVDCEMRTEMNKI